jgi:hypothetical protein
MNFVVNFDMQMFRIASSSKKRHLRVCVLLYRTWNEPRFTYGDEIRFPLTL